MTTTNYKLHLIAPRSDGETVIFKWFKIADSGEEISISQEDVQLNRGDTLLVEPDYGHCMSIQNLPVNIAEYKNLSLGVASMGNSDDVILGLFQGSNSQSNLYGVSAGHVPGKNDCFECIAAPSESITRGGSTEEFVASYKLRFAPGSEAINTITQEGEKLKLVYAFGDPHSGEIDINVGKK